MHEPLFTPGLQRQKLKVESRLGVWVCERIGGCRWPGSMCVTCAALMAISELQARHARLTTNALCRPLQDEPESPDSLSINTGFRRSMVANRSGWMLQVACAG